MPVQEYCLLWIDHWSTCMTKGEWSGWMQAVFSVVAILAAIGIAQYQRYSQIKEKRIEAHESALVAGMSVLSKLRGLLTTLNGACTLWDPVNDPEGAAHWADLLHDSFDMATLPSENELRALVVVPNECLAHLSKGLDEIGSIHMLLKTAHGEGRKMPQDVAIRLMVAVVGIAEIARVEFQMAQTSITGFCAQPTPR